MRPTASRIHLLRAADGAIVHYRELPLLCGAGCGRVVRVTQTSASGTFPAVDVAAPTCGSCAAEERAA